jgi:hypothetical protein
VLTKVDIEEKMMDEFKGESEKGRERVHLFICVEGQ